MHWVELLSTILLAAAAVATAWSTYQSTRWRGVQAIDYSKATAARIQSSEASTRAGQLSQVDIATFIQWVDADVAGNRKLARFYRRRFARSSARLRRLARHESTHEPEGPLTRSPCRSTGSPKPCRPAA